MSHEPAPPQVMRAILEIADAQDEFETAHRALTPGKAFVDDEPEKRQAFALACLRRDTAQQRMVTIARELRAARTEKASAAQ